MPTMEEIYSGPPTSAAPTDVCAGCGATGVSLLACDDMDAAGTAQPAQRSRYVKIHTILLHLGIRKQ